MASVPSDPTAPRPAPGRPSEGSDEDDEDQDQDPRAGLHRIGTQGAGGAPPATPGGTRSVTRPITSDTAAEETETPGDDIRPSGASASAANKPAADDLKPSPDQAAMTSTEAAPEVHDDLVATGISGLDAQYGGGLPVGNMILLLSQPMNAPSIFADQYAAQGLNDGERVYYYTLERPADDVREAVGHFVDDEAALTRLELLDGYPLQFQGLPRGMRERLGAADAEDLLEHLEGLLEDQTLQAPFRIVIDSFSELASHYEKKRVYRTLRILRGLVRNLGASAVVTMVEPLHSADDVANAKHVADGVIEFAVERKGFGIYPVILVSKMRGMPESQRMLLFKETDQGLWLESTKRVH